MSSAWSAASEGVLSLGVPFECKLPRGVLFRGIPLKFDGVFVPLGPEQGLWLQHDICRVVVSSQASSNLNVCVGAFLVFLLYN